VWPAEAPAHDAAAAVKDRVVEYLVKANREAKVRTSWTSPDDAYERAVESYITAALEHETFVTEMAAFARRVAAAGHCNALSRLLVHLTAPGTPDIYQGDEMWNVALVDPDNRRPVDFAGRRDALDRLHDTAGSGDTAARCADMLRTVADGRLKMHVTHTALALRRERPGLFMRGKYTPLDGRGEAQRHALAFGRSADGTTVVTAVTRLPDGLSGTVGIPTGLAWGAGEVIFPGSDVPHRWRCALTGLTVEAREADGGAALLAREVFLTLPIALLIAE
jgi:(1->4)-alpha-D-glucan 1-alpha-D-glucosylmutase